MAALQNAQAMAPANDIAGSGGLNAVPDSNTLLAYKLLQDSWDDTNVFQNLLHDEMKYLVAGISLLNNDPYLAMKMGGVTLNAAGQLAGIIKAKEQEIDLSSRIEPAAKAILTHKFAKPNMIEMMPGRRPPISLVRNGQGQVSMQLTAGQYANTGINMRAPYGVATIANILSAGQGGNGNAFGGINPGVYVPN